MAAVREFVICLDNHGYEVSLERRKLYEVLPDPQAAMHEQVRVIDESGEDYLYPSGLFSSIDLPQPLREALASAA